MHKRPGSKNERAEKREAKQVRKAARRADSQRQKPSALSQPPPASPASNARQPQAYVPSLGLLFRIFSLIRITAALSAPIQDCDEVFNYWEPLHMLQFGTGKQTWEYAPQFALRSYGFLKLYQGLASVLHVAVGFRSKTQLFYALRIAMGLACAGCEAVFVRGIAEGVDRRVALNTAVAMFGMAGMYHQGVALLPSTFAMYGCMLGAAAAMRRQDGWTRRVTCALAGFVVAAAVGWPYAVVVAVPFVAEELVAAAGSQRADAVRRVAAMAGLGLAFLAPSLLAMYVVDSHYYGRPVVAAWNQVAYNVLRRGGDSALYGTEPWYFYIQNGLINGNVIMLLALAALPLWAAYYAVLLVSTRTASADEQAAVRALFRGHHLLLPRTLPFGLALVVFSLQAHKEERFLSIVYPHMCFAAAVALSLLGPLGTWAVGILRRGGIGRGRALDVRRWTDRLSVAALCVATAVGFARIAALGKYYGAPMRVFSGVAQLGVQGGGAQQMPLLPLGPTVKMLGRKEALPASAVENNAGGTVCLADEWHYFPSSYWLPRGFRVEFVRGGFDGQLPGSYVPVGQSGSLRRSTSAVRPDFNSHNQWEPAHALNSTDACDYVVATEYPDRGMSIISDKGVWERVECADFLDAPGSRVLARVLYVPRRVVRMLEALEGGGKRPWQSWGRMCLFRRRLK
ncbi:mannosyltransferase [Coemansia interrupta]|uniref:Mannosyltransferase n=1 Tax=Coemansia interrupta TaxID=1126814 RepID=A0A9W8H8X1_9FUNG|nr:mannosyltransferase [Coemansia interrupta]